MSAIYSHAAIRKLINTYGMYPQKRWGQNFLIDRNSALKIVNALPQADDSVVWEIGPGFGALTELICERYRRVVLFEIDRALISYLCARWPQLSLIARERSATSAPLHLAPAERLTLVSGNALDTLPAALACNPPPDIVLGNLPYSIAAPLLLCFVRSSAPPRILTATIQQEMAQRISTRAGRNYSSFSALMQLVYRLQHRWTVSRAVFHPTPNVESTCVRLIRNDAAADLPVSNAPAPATTLSPPANGTEPAVGDATACASAAQIALVEPLLRAAFQSRRATLHKNMRISPRYCEAYQQLREWDREGTLYQHLRSGESVADSAPVAVLGSSGSLEELMRGRAEQFAPYQFVQLAELLQRVALAAASR